jgi:hydrogenase-4 component F
MMLRILFLAPFAAGLASLGISSPRVRRRLITIVSFFHLACTLIVWRTGFEPSAGRWIGLDALSMLFLLITSVLFASSSFATVAYLRGHELPVESRGRFSREAVFTCAMLFFLGTTTLAILSLHTGVFWMAIEATTLASAPLISYQRSSRSLEATWKYLLICSVGIAIALVGNTALAVSVAFDPATYGLPMTFRDLAERAVSLNPVWLKVAFALILVGYGTKMGLAPMHTWLPDAHSEAPSPVSALLSGALLNCAFLGILRTNAILVRAGIGGYSNGLLAAFGALSMLLAGWFVLRQADFKRLLAYSSIEHMGILAIAAGAGASFGGLLHALNHSLTKGALFLLAGTILGAYHTKSTRAVSGLIRISPATGLLWIAGFLAICGVPPFGTFVSEFSVMAVLGRGGRWWLLAAFLSALGIVFVGMWRIVIPMAFGRPSDPAVCVPRSCPIEAADVPPLALCCMVLLFGIWLPSPIARLIEHASAIAGGL